MTLPGSCGVPVSRTSRSEVIKSCRLRSVDDGPPSHSSPSDGVPRRIPFASHPASTQRSAEACVVRTSAWRISIRSSMASLAHSSAWSRRMASASSHSSFDVGGMRSLSASGMAAEPFCSAVTKYLLERPSVVPRRALRNAPWGDLPTAPSSRRDTPRKCADVFRRGTFSG